MRSKGGPDKPSPVVLAAGVVSAGLGLTALASAPSQAQWLIEFMGPMFHSNAVGFLLSGLGLVAVGLERRWLATLAGALTAALGAVALMKALFDLDIGVEHLFRQIPEAVREFPAAHLAPNSAFCLVLTGLALLLMSGVLRPRYRFSILVGLGTIVASTGPAAFGGYVAAAVVAHPWERLAPLAVHSAVGFAVVGGGLIAFQRPLASRRLAAGPGLAPFLVAVFVLSGTFILWSALKSTQEAHLARSVPLAAADLKSQLTTDVNASILALEGMAQRWEIHGPSRREEWESDARRYLRHFSACQVLAWLDAGYQPCWIIGRQEPAPDELRLVSLPPVRTALAGARRQRRVSLTRAIPLEGDGKGFLAAVPLFFDGQFQGFLIGALRFQDLVASGPTGPRFGAYAMASYDGGSAIRAHNQGELAGSGPWTRVAALGMGLLIAVLGSLAVHLAQTTGLRANKVEAANLELGRARDELERRVQERTAELSAANRELLAEIAERKRAEETLRASEERYRDLFDSANDLVYTQDLEGRLTSLNRAAERAIGYSREEALRMNIAELLVPEDRELAQQMLARKLGGEASITYEVSLLTKGARRLVVEVNTHLLYQDGQPVGVHGIAREITERKRLEEQLRQSQKMEAVGRLAGGIAHDFNNMLTVVAAYSHMLLEGLRDSEPHEGYAQEILRAAERASALTNQLLAFSRRQVIQPKILDLNALILGMSNMLRRLIGEDIELITRLSPELGRVKADPGQLEQVLMNLTVNAWDAMPSGGRLTLQTLNVDSHTLPTPGSYVLLSVTDTGLGMDPDTQSHIFEPFFTTKGPGKGTGLGLATVYGIVTLSGGEILVDSQPGKGSTFRIYLPRVEEDHLAAEEPGAVARPYRGSETVLLVEDEDGVRKLVRHMLSLHGYRVLEAADCEEALELAARHQGSIHLLLTDVVMPRMSGRELAERLAPLHPAMKVLYMTGYTDDETVHHGVAQDSLAVLQKPFRAEALARMVREVLDGILSYSPASSNT